MSPRSAQVKSGTRQVDCQHPASDPPAGTHCPAPAAGPEGGGSKGPAAKAPGWRRPSPGPGTSVWQPKPLSSVVPSPGSGGQRRSHQSQMGGPPACWRRSSRTQAPREPRLSATGLKSTSHARARPELHCETSPLPPDAGFRPMSSVQPAGPCPRRALLPGVRVGHVQTCRALSREFIRAEVTTADGQRHLTRSRGSRSPFLLCL